MLASVGIDRPTGSPTDCVRSFLEAWVEPAGWDALGTNTALKDPGFVGLFSGDNRSSLFARVGAAVDGAPVPVPSNVVLPVTQTLRLGPANAI